MILLFSTLLSFSRWSLKYIKRFDRNRNVIWYTQKNIQWNIKKIQESLQKKCQLLDIRWNVSLKFNFVLCWPKIKWHKLSPTEIYSMCIMFINNSAQFFFCFVFVFLPQRCMKWYERGKKCQQKIIHTKKQTQVNFQLGILQNIPFNEKILKKRIRFCVCLNSLEFLKLLNFKWPESKVWMKRNFFLLQWC